MKLVTQAPVSISSVAPGVALVDFGRVAFGNLRLLQPAGAAGEVTVHFGEALADGRVNRTPPGSVRYSMTRVTLGGATSVVAAPPPDARNTRQPAAVLTPPDWGVVTPFRWVEIEGWPGELRPEHLRRQAAFAATWDDGAATFASSDELLDRIWELCRYSIKATTFAGVYVDGDRERIPYEADAYLNQLSHYATDRDVQMARDTFDHLMAHPTWPTEWAFHMIFIAHADWMHTGDTEWLAARYEALKPKLLRDRARADGLLASSEAQRTKEDIVDWPAGERDGYVFTPVNTVVNAFHLRALALMADLAAALGREAEAAEYRSRERSSRSAFQRALFDPARGLYRDGEGTDHVSAHANLFPLAFGLVPAAHAAGRVGMAGQPRDALLRLRGAVSARRPLRARHRRRGPGARHRVFRSQLAPHGGQRNHDHVGGVGSEVQAQPGLEPRVGGGAGQSPPPLRARCAAARARLATRQDQAVSRPLEAGVRHDPDAARAGADRVDQ